MARISDKRSTVRDRSLSWLATAAEIVDTRIFVGVGVRVLSGGSFQCRNLGKSRMTGSASASVCVESYVYV